MMYILRGKFSRQGNPRFGALQFVLFAISVQASLIAAETASFTVGIDTTCPYGIVNCWPEVREPIEGLRGVKTVSSRVDPKTLTCEVQMEQGLLLDAKALNKRVKDEAGRSSQCGASKRRSRVHCFGGTASGFCR